MMSADLNGLIVIAIHFFHFNPNFAFYCHDYFYMHEMSAKTIEKRKSVVRNSVISIPGNWD
jgi:hypothetical protein